MHVGRQRAEWGRASLLASLLHNNNVERKDRKTPDFFNPYAEKRTAVPSRVDGKTFINALWSMPRK